MRMLRPLLGPAARRVLGDRFEPRDVASILRAAFDDYERRRAEVPREGGAARAMVHLAALTAALYRVLLARGLTEGDARRRVADLAWLVYEKMAAVPWAIACVTKRAPRARLQKATDSFRRFPFGPPGYDMVDVPAEAGVVAFDVRRCPVAEYFRAQGLAELCVEAWCDLDIALAEKWGARLERTGTLAGGADRCDFRWCVRGALEAVR